MQFRPKTAEEIALEGCIAEGIYPFTVLEAHEAVSKKGNEMIKLVLLVYGPDRDVRINDYLLEAFAHKLRHFCEFTGLIQHYESGNLRADLCVGREGYVKIAIKKQEGYDPRNEVKDYVTKPGAGEGGSASKASAQGAPVPEDDIPF